MKAPMSECQEKKSNNISISNLNLKNINYPFIITKLDQKKYKCTHPGCSKRFKEKGNLTGIRPYPCRFSECGKRFSTLGNLKSHEFNHTAENCYKCPVEGCDRSFKRIIRLKIHERTHSGKKPYYCPFANCNRVFNEKGNLKTHYRIHTGEKPYKCNFKNCIQSFKANGQLVDHLHRHSKILGKETVDDCKNIKTYEAETNILKKPADNCMKLDVNIQNTQNLNIQICHNSNNNTTTQTENDNNQGTDTQNIQATHNYSSTQNIQNTDSSNSENKFHESDIKTTFSKLVKMYLKSLIIYNNEINNNMLQLNFYLNSLVPFEQLISLLNNSNNYSFNHIKYLGENINNGGFINENMNHN